VNFPIRQRAAAGAIRANSRSYRVAQRRSSNPATMCFRTARRLPVGVVAADNKVTIKSVTLGPQFGDMWVVDSGLQAGENVVWTAYSG